jgi:hypothetical protein
MQTIEKKLFEKHALLLQTQESLTSQVTAQGGHKGTHTFRSEERDIN